MTKRVPIIIRCSLILATAALVSIAIFADGCNTTQPPNRQLSDVQITTRVKAKLASDVGGSSLTNVDVSTTNGIVTLSGQVQSADKKQKAQTVTASLPGVVRVNNNIQVQSPPGSANAP
ncbi:MAG: BON domain-containing protein [Candidatus Sulfotelmatobacter sp.]